MNRSQIDGITVRSNYRYIVYGSVRTLVSEHRSLNRARESLARDQKGCAKQRGYSDASVYEWDNAWVELLGDDLYYDNQEG